MIEEAFDDFLEAISLKETQKKRIESAYGALKAHIETHLDESLNEPESVICYRQGSFENGTSVEPVDGGEYDVDIIVEFSKWPEDSSAALDLLARVVRSNDTYRDNVKVKKSCVRVDYKDDSVGNFHVDLVPARRIDSQGLIEVPNKHEGWHLSNPQAFTMWCLNQGASFIDIVKIFKRWRDENQSAKQAVKSIQLQVLLSDAFVQVGERKSLDVTCKRLFSELTNLLSTFTENDQLPNPVLPSEDLARNWTKSQISNFRNALGKATTTLENSYNNDDSGIAVSEAWSQILGEDFPDPSRFQIDKRGSVDHRKDLWTRGWRLSPTRTNIGVSVRIETYGKRVRALKDHEKRSILSGKSLCFELDRNTVPRGAEIWWQVTNTGAHAIRLNAGRGDFIKAKARKGNSLSQDPCVHWEDTLYHGTHIVQAFAVVDGLVKALTDEVEVRVADRNYFRQRQNRHSLRRR